MTAERPENEVPLPPADAERFPRVCRYCIVGCGYEVFKWPVGEEGGPTADENALEVDFPTDGMDGNWPSPHMHQVIRENGQEYNVLFKPDDDSVVNKGQHSVRGGTQAESLYSPYSQGYDDRLKQPQIRIGGSLTPVDWDTAIEAFARVTEYATEQNGPNGYGQKMFFYQFVENTYAGTKLCFDVIGSPNWGGHNRPALTPECPGMVNAGLSEWSYSYEDAAEADTIVIAGGDPFENQDVIFEEYIDQGDADIVQINPRRTFMANYAENQGGVFLQVNEATDPVLLNAIARHIVDQGWHDETFIDEWLMNDREAIDDEGWYNEEFGMTPEEYFDLLDDPQYAPENAAELTGVSAEDIRAAAELIAQPDAEETNTLFMLEKGLIWGWSHENTGAYANLPLLTGSVGREGTGITRLGGHQEGFWTPGSEGSVIEERSTQTFDGERVSDATIPPNATHRVRDGEILHWHVIGMDPLRHSYSTQDLRNRVRERTSGPQPQSADIDEIERAFRERIDQGGMVITHQEIYPNTTTEYADIVLPALASEAGEGGNYHRWNGERRLRHYAGFMEGPSNAKADWEIFKLLGQRLGADDMDWERPEEIFTEITRDFEGGEHDMHAIYEVADEQGKTPAELMRELDTDGVQMPTYVDDSGDLAGTPRVHAPDDSDRQLEHRFHTGTGKAIFQRVDWNRVSDVYEQISPNSDAGEIWVTNGRVNRLWQNMYTHQRLDYIKKRYEQNIIELNPNDAAERGIEAGDLVEIVNEDVYNQHGENKEGSFTAVAYITEDPPQGQVCPEGVAFAYWLYPEQVNNDIVPAYLDPANPNPGYKYGKGKIRRLGESDVKDEMSFKARNVAPE